MEGTQMVCLSSEDLKSEEGHSLQLATLRRSGEHVKITGRLTGRLNLSGQAALRRYTNVGNGLTVRCYYEQYAGTHSAIGPAACGDFWGLFYLVPPRAGHVGDAPKLHLFFRHERGLSYEDLDGRLIGTECHRTTIEYKTRIQGAYKTYECGGPGRAHGMNCYALKV
jgi:hypothetical protein